MPLQERLKYNGKMGVVRIRVRFIAYKSNNIVILFARNPCSAYLERQYVY